ncbi:LysR family transcriptional regulator [Cupriavidus sp. D384]|uniref:LysR family transcriptional regulator n=1 Tax=Cupriavidus sp. D384 TaxID=1538095 RepID=UPI00083514BF|nr:LysR family transcriptional regulator [Cupriavidus sp. D384]
MRLSTAQLDAFLALCETLRFSLAAERVHVSTSAFSQIISRLEEDVGVRLFDRSTRHVALTPEGEIFELGARRIAAEVDFAMDELRARIAGKSGEASIAATPTPCVSWLPERLSEFSKGNSGIRINLRDGVSQRCFEMVSQGITDLALAAEPGDLAEFEATPLFDAEFSVLLRKDDPLSARRRLSLSQLVGRDFVHVAGRGDVWEQRLMDLRKAGIRDSGFEVTNFGTLVGLISAGFGLGVVPRMALPLCQRDDLVSRPLTDAHFVRRFYLVRRRGRSLSTAATLLWDHLVAASKKSSSTFIPCN